MVSLLEAFSKSGTSLDVGDLRGEAGVETTTPGLFKLIDFIMLDPIAFVLFWYWPPSAFSFSFFRD